MKRFLKWVGRFIVIPLLLIGIGAVGAAWFLIDGATKVNANGNWFETPGGIDEMDFVSLGGVDQYIRIRGRDRANPVMLDLHGGPGGAQSGMTHRALRPLTEYFTLVEWDQRGAGKSTGDESLISTMNYQRMVDDTVALIEHLQSRLDVDKVILVGHSWGSMLGLGVAQQRPDLIAAYVGVGQALAWNAAFDETARLLIEEATRAGDQETVGALMSLPPSGLRKTMWKGFSIALW